jgi:thioredoxin 1
MANIETLTSEEVESKVLQASGPVALDFYQASCPPCRVLEPRLEHIAQQYAAQLPVYRVDVERDLPVVERWGVKSIPTVLIFQAGKEVERLDRLITDGELKAAFDRAIGV